MSNPDYRLSGYGELIADRVRMGAYEEALRAACRPGCVVLDIGTGTGIMALLACRFGARRVYAVDFSDAVSVGREIAHASGLGERIEFIQGLSTEVSLPEPVDVVVADVRGVLPAVGTSLATMMNARRFLAPDGVVIPERDTIRGALVERAVVHEQMMAPWRTHALGFDCSAAERLVVNTWRRALVPAGALLTTPSDFCELDYATIAGTNVLGSISTEVIRSGTAHGLCIWFDAKLFGDAGFSNAPGQPSTVYGQGFFPLPEPVVVETGDVVSVALRATQMHDDYLWNWNTTIVSASGAPKGRFAQSTARGAPLSAASLWKLDRTARPALGPNGQIDRFILERLDGQTPLAALAELLRARFPERFPDESSALDRVTAITSRYDCEHPSTRAPKHPST